MEWNAERARIESEDRRAQWSRWGPYVSDRQWGTVREDYSSSGDAWNYFPFEHARSRAYRWGEDGIFGISDRRQQLCFAPAFWNGNDAILKERLFGLNGHEGNHGEDVKECYYYLDNVPSHAYMKALYKYPQRAFPYDDLRVTNAARGKGDAEYELVDTGIFDDDAYFDIVVEYAKHGPTDIAIAISATNRGSTAAALHVVPQLWFRNEWSWAEQRAHGAIAIDPNVPDAFLATHRDLGTYRLLAESGHTALFTENETNFAEVFGGTSAQPYVKDAIDRAIVRGETGATNPADVGSKVGLHFRWMLLPGETKTLRLRLADVEDEFRPIDAAFGGIFHDRAWEADRFYAALNPFPASAEHHRVQRTAFAGMLWSKQYYYYVVRDWLRGDPLQPPPPAERYRGRNHDWKHLFNEEIISMPDTWEYPWYASWDLAFQALTFAVIDPGFAKRQLLALTRERYMHPNGAIPGYEWSFESVNPPLQAWAAYRIFQIEHKMYGVSDYLFLERVFQKLLMNFTWWINREDPTGENVFAGGFLGLDNIGIFDRNEPLPTGGRLVEADATSWMCVYALDMLAIALELAQHLPSYEDIATKFFEHFLFIATAMNSSDESALGLWDARDGFYYDKVVMPDGSEDFVRVRSVVGLLPMLAVETLQPAIFDKLPAFKRRVEWFVANRPELSRNVASMASDGLESRRLLSVLDPDRLRSLLLLMLDEREFLSPHGVRALSKYHKDHPFVVTAEGNDFRVDYEPGASTTGLFGGNSNWRGPVWFPLNYLLIEALQNFHFFYGDDYRVEFPVGSGTMVTLWDVATELSYRLIALFVPNEAGDRPFNGSVAKFQTDPHFRSLLLFHEYFHGDTGAGLGASHQTGWTGLVAKLIQQTSEYESARKSPLDWKYDAEPTIEKLPVERT